jgi:hypothetical protein
MKTLKAQPTETKLEKAVRLIVNNHTSGYDSGVKGFMEDLMHGGCVSGLVGELIYYTDTTAFYKKHEAEIDQLLSESMESIGVDSPKEMFGDKWDNGDPLAKDTFNQNLLAWFAFEETARNLASAAGVEV